MLTLLITLDCVRADYVLKPAADTPVLDAFRRECVTFTRAVSHTNTTLPSHVTMFTGRLLPEHGVVHNFYKPSGESFTLTEGLAGAGIESAGFVGTQFLECLYASRLNGEDPFYDLPESRILRGVLRRLGLRGTRRTASATLDAALAWIRSRAGLPSFCWAHLFDTHMDYLAGEPWKTRYEVPEGKSKAPLGEILQERGWTAYHPVQKELREADYYLRMYPAAVSSTDDLLGRFFRTLRVLGLWEEALIVVTADHGENLLEHGVYCGHPLLFDETIRVPLLVKFPGNEYAGRVVHAPVGHEDLAPTILALRGAPPCGGAGIDLRRHLNGGGSRKPRALLAFHNKMFQGSVRRGDRTWIENLDISDVKPEHRLLYEETGLFDVAGRPIDEPDTAAALSSILHAYLKRTGSDEKAEAVEDEDIKAQLRGLGYME